MSLRAQKLPAEAEGKTQTGGDQESPTPVSVAWASGFPCSCSGKDWGAPAGLPRSIWGGAVRVLGNCRVVQGIGTQQRLFSVELINNCLEIALSELKYDVPYLEFSFIIITII